MLIVFEIQAKISFLISIPTAVFAELRILFTCHCSCKILQKFTYIFFKTTYFRMFNYFFYPQRLEQNNFEKFPVKRVIEGQIP